MGVNLDAVRAAVLEAIPLANEFHASEAKFYILGNPVPVLVTPCRVKKPRASSFEASNETLWGTKRVVRIRIPVDAPLAVIAAGLIVQISGADDPSINNINFVVQNSAGGTFAAEREVILVSDVQETPRIT